MVRIIALIAVLFTLSGCLLATGPGLFALSTATFINTKKTVGDHAVTWMTGQDCSTLKYTKGEGYCRPREGEEVQDGANYGPDGTYLSMGPYCYRTLGRVTCYDQPDSMASGYARLQ